ncbi:MULTISPECIES: lantibiotic dehydratase [unclassified Kitasatospora]|uniref:lantibiotic dehydratase n=1 Tax=unclassified Kitasatospora TaxID=2633591 RepID=UPI0038214EBB
MDEDRELGAAALLRVAGMPLAAWAAAGNPELFAQVADHARRDERRAEHARRLAEQLGIVVVPHPALTAADRRAVLAVRRRLHSGAAPGPADCGLLGRLPAAGGLVADAARLSGEAESAAVALRRLEAAVAAERERVGALGWSLVCASPVMRAFLDEVEPGAAADVAGRLAAGESWSGKRLRKRAAYVWRALGRAAAKTTPRGWVGQVILLPVTPTGANGGGNGGGNDDGNGGGADGTLLRLVPPGTTLGEVAAQAVENVHGVRARLGALDLRAADPATVLALAPLHFPQPAGTAPGAGVLRCWVTDPHDRGRLRQVDLRRSLPLDHVLAQLAGGPRPLGDLEAALLGTATTVAAAAGAAASAPTVLRGFLAHLLGLGVLQACAAPRRRTTGWLAAEDVHARGTLPQPAPPPTPAPSANSAAPAPIPAPAPASALRTTGSAAPADDSRPWFTDSYRTIASAVSGAAARQVQQGLGTAARVAWLREADRLAGPDPHRLPAELAELTERPCPLGEILARHLPDGSCPPPPQPPRRYAGWHPAETSGSGYAGLLAHLSARAGSGPVDLDDDLLDILGAPPAATALPPWPLDCLLRPLPGPGPVAVLETASPAGVLDARFADALHTLHGGYDNLRSYRAFLASVERLSGARFVELLVPPLAGRAANAVRRPVITGWWTGDPDPLPYQGADGLTARYLPLERITLRRVGPRIIAEADGCRLLPVHHATRTPLPPYDVLVRLLLAAGHPAGSRLIRLDGLAEAFPDTDRLPRVTVGGGALVISPAVWRVPPAQLWRPGDGDLTKVRALAALGRSAGLPRFAFVRAVPQPKPVPVDFAALTAVALLERICARHPGADLLVEEMLPDPGGLLLHDPVHGGAAVAAQLLLRLPFDQGAEELAEPAAAALRGEPDVPGAPAPRGRATGAVSTHHRS